MNIVFKAPYISRPDGRASIDAIESEMIEKEQAECPVVHRFGPGVYIREVTLPAGVFAIGHYQKQKHMNVVLTGRVSMMQEDGSTREFKAGDVFQGKPGRKMGYIHEETRWLNIYSTHETDVEKLESWFLGKSQGFTVHHNREMTKNFLAREMDRTDFKDAIESLGFSESEVTTQSENKADQVPFPPGEYKIKVSLSPIHGQGIFATAPIKSGEIIAPARLKNGMRTPAGRFTNHSKTPNAIMKVSKNGGIDLCATRDISGCKGGRDGEEITIDYRESVKLAMEMK